MFHDSELPNGYQDADLEMASLQAAGDRSAELRRRGVCDHGWLMAPEGKPATCNDCGAVFASFEEAREAGRAILAGE